MNKKQRIVLIIGATALVYFLFTSPKISIVKGTYVVPPPDKENIAKMIDIRTAIIRAVAILGGTLLIVIALKDRKGKRTSSAMDGEIHSEESCQSDTRHKESFDKLRNFLKNFF